GDGGVERVAAFQQHLQPGRRSNRMPGRNESVEPGDRGTRLDATVGGWGLSGLLLGHEGQARRREDKAGSNDDGSAAIDDGPHARESNIQTTNAADAASNGSRRVSLLGSWCKVPSAGCVQGAGCGDQLNPEPSPEPRTAAPGTHPAPGTLNPEPD